MTDSVFQDDNTVTFSERLGRSSSFLNLYREGMALVEDAAHYLDGQGRQDAKDLPRVLALAYATESMRLTTRLMQMASWLLLQRAIADGEMQGDTAQEERRRMVLPTPMNVKSDEYYAELPSRLRELIEASHSIFERIRRLDTLLNQESDVDEAPVNPVAGHLDALKNAFS